VSEIRMTGDDFAKARDMNARRPSWRRPAWVVVIAGLAWALGACAPIVVGAGSTAGASAAQERGFKGTMDDQAIRLDINDRWFKKDVALYSAINLQVQEGRVLLSGRVPDPQTRVNAVRLAWQAKGVREVINEIEVDDESSLGDSAQDSWIATKLRARLIADSDIRSLNYSIETVNGSVYLMGVAQNDAELQRVIAHARDISHVRRVVSYVRVKEAPAPSS